MIQKKRFYLFVFFFIIFTTYSLKEPKKIFNIIFPIEEITIEGTSAINLSKLKIELEFLKKTSLFFLKDKEITAVTDNYDFIKSIQLRSLLLKSVKNLHFFFAICVI